MNCDDAHWMQRALELAAQGAAAGEVPVGAVIVGRDGSCIGEGINKPISSCDPTAHAEVVALRDAASHSGNYRLPGCTLYVTLEPCLMCCGALVHARIERLVYATREPKAGAVESAFNVLDSASLNHQVRVTRGVMAEASAALLQTFFASRRAERRLPEMDRPMEQGSAEPMADRRTPS